ncbi:MAG: pilus assembly protein PilM [Candidatus Omnitrophota bacterium]|jgi:Tfp pilus assembly PilM family ATPase
MPKRAVGIHILSKYVDIAELSGLRSSPVLLSFRRQEIVPGIIGIGHDDEKDASLAWCEGVVSAIRNGIEGLRSKPQLIYTVLPSGDTMVRYFDMPFLPKSEQAQAVRFEAKKYVPFRLDEIISDFKVQASSKAKRSIDIFFVAATKDRLNNHTAKFTAAGLHAAGIDIIPFALLRVLMLHKKAEAKNGLVILYVDDDKKSISISVIRSGIPFMSRDIKVLTDDKESLFEKVASELMVSIDYYRRQRIGCDVSKIVICGERLFAGLDAYISNELKVATETLYDFTKIKNADKVPSTAITAIGAAMGGLGRSNYSVNLSPFHAIAEKRQALNVRAAQVIAAAVIILATYLLSGLFLKSGYLELSQLEQISASLPITTSVLDVETLIKKKDAMLEAFRCLQLIQSDRISLARQLSAITARVEEQRKQAGGLWIDKIAFKETIITNESKLPAGINREMVLSGGAFSSDDAREMDYVHSFLGALKSDGDFTHYFKDIELGSVDRTNISDKWVASFSILAYSQPPKTAQGRRGRR